LINAYARSILLTAAVSLLTSVFCATAGNAKPSKTDNVTTEVSYEYNRPVENKDICSLETAHISLGKVDKKFYIFLQRSKLANPCCSTQRSLSKGHRLQNTVQDTERLRCNLENLANALLFTRQLIAFTTSKQVHIKTGAVYNEGPIVSGRDDALQR